jgi:23S rRNA pseudouridine1911/1915/1917 synthase
VLAASPADAGARVDVWLSRAMPGLSRSRVQALIRSGHIRAEAQAPLVAHTRVRVGLRVRVAVPPAEAPSRLAPEPIPLDVLFEDPDLIVINKQAGIVVHPAAGHRSGTLVNALLHHCRDLRGIKGSLRPGIVHRLDKDTSGALVVAKSEPAMDGLVAQFKAGAVEKEYLALARGCPRPPSGRIETLIGRNPRDRTRMCAKPERGRRAVTCYRVIEDLGSASLVRVRIETGRTHQIRVHMAHLGHPVLGDRQYGRCRRIDAAPAAARQMLHAARLSFVHPVTDEPVRVRAPLPADMERMLNALRAGAGGNGAARDRRGRGLRRPGSPPISEPEIPDEEA